MESQLNQTKTVGVILKWTKYISVEDINDEFGISIKQVSTVVPTKSDSDVMFCLQMLS